MDPDRITEADMPEPRDYSGLLTREEWWAEFNANACCSSPEMARRYDCGCGGNGEIPTGISDWLWPDEDGEELHLRRMASRADYRKNL